MKGVYSTVSAFGIKLAPTYTTPAVQGARENLRQRYINYSYRTQPTKGLLDFLIHSQLPQPNNSDGAKLQVINQQYHVALGHMEFMRHGANAGWALDCWKFPFRCLNIKAEIDGRVPEVHNFYFGELILSCRNPAEFLNIRQFCPNPVPPPPEYKWLSVDIVHGVHCQAHPAYVLRRWPFTLPCEGKPMYPITRWNQ